MMVVARVNPFAAFFAAVCHSCFAGIGTAVIALVLFLTCGSALKGWKERTSEVAQQPTQLWCECQPVCRSSPLTAVLHDGLSMCTDLHDVLQHQCAPNRCVGSCEEVRAKGTAHRRKQSGRKAELLGRITG